MKITVRNATSSDAATIANFQVAMARETEDKALDSALVETAVLAVFEDPSKGFYLVAEMEGVVVASLLITTEWSDWRNSDMWYIQSVFVIREQRGKGVFKTMYGLVMDLAKAQAIKFVRLYVEIENEAAQNVYQSLGMKRMPYYMYDAEV